jgi:hypothetical protein
VEDRTNHVCYRYFVKYGAALDVVCNALETFVFAACQFAGENQTSVTATLCALCFVPGTTVVEDESDSSTCVWITLPVGQEL